MVLTKSVREMWRDRPIIYWIYYILGGIYVTDEFSKWAKYIWFGLTACVLSTYASCAIGYFLKSKPVTLYSAILVLTHTCGPIIVVTNITLLTLYCHSDINEVLKFIQSTHPGELTSTSLPNVDVSKLLLIKRIRLFPKEMVVIKIFMWIMILVSPLLDFAFNYEKEEFGRNVDHHLVGIPFMDRISSLLVYWGTYFLEILLLLFFLLFLNSQSLFIEMIARSLNNKVVDICERFQRLNALFEDKISVSDQKSPELVLHFQRKLRLLIKEYQTFTRMVDRLRSYIETISTFYLPANFFYASFLLFVFLLMDLNFTQKMRLLISTMVGEIYTYTSGYSFGTAIEEMNDEMAYQVYNLPWHCLPPKKRKEVYIFLVQAQYFAPFNVFRLFPVNKIFFPKVLNLAYSYVNVLAAVLKRNR